MNLVADTNILFSFFRDNPVRSIILNSRSLGLELFSPKYALEELSNKKRDLIKYTKLSELDLDEIFALLKEHIKIKNTDFFDIIIKRATKFCPDKKDVLFFALALKLNCPLWSNEPQLKNQSIVNVFNTSQIRKQFNL